MADNRDTQLGIDSTGAEFWLIPRPGRAPGGHRTIEIRNSKKHVPEQLQGMWTSGDTAQRAFDDYLTGIKSAKKGKAKVKPEKVVEPEKAES